MKKILIVEDVEMNRDLLVQLLEDRYQLFEAGSGQQGLELALRERPDLVLLDISLPGMDGYEVARQLRADPDLGRTPLIAVTAHAMTGDQEHIFQQGFDDYLAKPIDEEELWAKIDKHLA